jgi:predicted membrane-bound spermidine synthase
VLVLAAAFAAGAAGLGIESIVLPLAGLAVGQSLASAFGLGSFVAGWACGAWLAGRSRAPLRRGFVVLAVAVPAVVGAATAGVLALGATGAAARVSTPITLLLIALVALPQGAFLPWLARAASAQRVSALFASNLLGALLGAWSLGYVAVAEWGRLAALALACAAAVLAALLGAMASSGTRVDAANVSRTPLRAGWIVGCATLWTVGLEWLCLRLGVLWIGSQQLALATVIACSLLALALGAALVPLVVPRDGRGVLAVLMLAAIASTWPLWAAPSLSAARAHGDVATVLVLCVPTLVPLGAVVPTLHRALSGESGARLGALLLHEAWGALAAGPLVHLLLVPSFGLRGAIAALCACGAAAALASFGERRAWAASAAVVALACAALAMQRPQPALASPKLVDPALSIRAFTEDREFAVTVVDDGILGERTLLTDQFRAAGTGRDYRYMRALGHLPVLLHPAPKRVAVVALGTGTTLGAVSMHAEVEQIDVLEISPAVVAMAPHFEAVNRGALSDPRVRVRIDDARRSLALEHGKYDVITMEPLLPDSPFGVYLYTREFYAVAKRALAPGGVMCQWVPPHALEPEVFDAVLDAFARAFEWKGAWLFGTQVILIGGEREPVFDSETLAPRVAGELARELDGLLLADTGDIANRFVADLARWPACSRPLADTDPWIAFRTKPTGLESLGWLPENLERLLATGGELSPKSLLSESHHRWLGLRALQRARVEFGRAELELRAGRLDAASARDRALAPLRTGAFADPTWERFEDFRDEVEFLYTLRFGVSALQQGEAERALDPLVLATKLRPERGDAHVYLAAARARLGLDEGARAELAKARELCPRIAETPAGLRARELGLDFTRYRAP